MIPTRGRIIFLKSGRAQANQANQQCQFKSSRWCMDPLGTDSCRGTVPMEPPTSNGSMHPSLSIYLDDGYIAWVFVSLFSFNRILEYEIVKNKYFILEL
jgi:hypothetical protein